MTNRSVSSYEYSSSDEVIIDVEVACVSSLANDLLSVDNPYANVADNGQFITRKADLEWSNVYSSGTMSDKHVFYRGKFAFINSSCCSLQHTIY
jgi:hypothetical protein